MRIGDKQYSEIIISDKEDTLIASITDEDIIEEKDYKVVCVPINKELENNSDFLDKAIEKANRLIVLLREAQQITDSLSEGEGATARFIRDWIKEAIENSIHHNSIKYSKSTIKERGKALEDKQKILDLLLPALKETRNLSDLVSLTYDCSKEIVIALFTSGGVKLANVAMDSGTAMIKDLIKQIV